MIELRNVSLRLGRREILTEFSWSLPDPGAYLLLGPTGSGKSVLLSLLCGELKPARGQVLIDGQPLHRLIGGYGEPIFIARAEQAAPQGESLEEYLLTELRSMHAPASLLDGAWPELEHFMPGARQRRLAQLSHGQFLLAQVALAAALPLRLVLLDGHLTYLDAAACKCVANLLAPAVEMQEKFIVLSASRLARNLPSILGAYVLSRELPLRLEALTDGQAVDADAGAIVAESGMLRVYFAPQSWAAQRATSGQHYAIIERLEDGVRVQFSGSLDAVLAELRAQGLVVQRVEMEGV